MSITKVELLPIRPQKGLIAFACVEIDHKFYVSSIGVHKRRDGAGYRITYPTRKVGEQNLTIFHPTQASLSKEIERVIDKVRDYKARQAEIVEQMARHEKANQNFYITANMVMNLTARAREIFESSEVDEKRQLLNFVFQNLKLDGKNLSRYL